MSARLIIRLLFGFSSDLTNSTNLHMNSETAMLSRLDRCSLYKNENRHNQQAWFTFVSADVTNWQIPHFEVSRLEVWMGMVGNNIRWWLFNWKNRLSAILNFLPEQLHEEVSLLSLSWEPVVGGDGELEENVPAERKKLFCCPSEKYLRDHNLFGKISEKCSQKVEGSQISRVSYSHRVGGFWTI